ncbi:ubiquitin thioesterase otubain-like protein [Wolffia australiana]
MSSPSSVESSVEECSTSNSSPKPSAARVLEHSFLRLADGPETSLSLAPEGYDWIAFRDDDILHQQSSILQEEAQKMPCVGDKEPLSALATEYESGSPILQEKIKMLSEHYSAMRRTRGDGNCFFRSFMFSYLEHILETQDKAEVLRIKSNIEESKKTLQALGYAEFTFEDYFEAFKDFLDAVTQKEGVLMSAEDLLQKSRDHSYSDSVVMFLRFVTTGEIRRRAAFFEPFILGFSNGIGTVDQFCKSSVEPMGEESDHVHITALTDALGVAVRVVYLDRSSCDDGPLKVNHHDFVPSNADPSPRFVSLLYRPGHYDILYSSPTSG